MREGPAPAMSIVLGVLGKELQGAIEDSGGSLLAAKRRVMSCSTSSQHPWFMEVPEDVTARSTFANWLSP